MNQIDRRRAQRTQFMNELYDLADGSDFQPIDTRKIAEKLGLDMTSREGRIEVLNIARYLEGEYLIKLTGSAGNVVSLTHEGVREVEAARSQPDSPTEHFAPVNIVYAESISNTAIQQGSPGATQSLTVTTQSNLQWLWSFLRSLSESMDQLGLDEEQQAELEADIRTLEAQVESPKPKDEVIKPGLQSISRILEGTVAGATGSGLFEVAQALISSM